MRKKKMLFIHNTMAPYRLPIFGELSKRYDLKVLFIRITHFGRRWQEPQSGLKFDYIVSRGLDIFGARICFDLLTDLANNTYSVVIVAESSVETIPACLIAVLYKFLKGAKIILMSERFMNRNARAQESFLRRGARIVFDTYLRFVYRNCDAFVACSSKAADHLSRQGRIEKKKIFKSIQAVFEIPQAPSQEVKQSAGGIITILTVAYLEDRKGIDNLITAFIALNKVNTQLIIAGDGEARGRLKAMASGCENIFFTGHIDGVVKQGLYEAADIFVLPSHFETWGLVVNEAMHYGLPVIITDTMGATDLIHGNGIIIPAGDSEALLQALQQLVESREARYTMGRRSREIIQSVDLNASTAPFIKAIDYVARRKKTEIFEKHSSQSKSKGRRRTFQPACSRQPDPGGFQEQQKE